MGRKFTSHVTTRGGAGAQRRSKFTETRRKRLALRPAGAGVCTMILTAKGIMRGARRSAHRAATELNNFDTRYTVEDAFGKLCLSGEQVVGLEL